MYLLISEENKNEGVVSHIVFIEFCGDKGFDLVESTLFSIRTSSSVKSLLEEGIVGNKSDEVYQSTKNLLKQKDIPFEITKIRSWSDNIINFNYTVSKNFEKIFGRPLNTSDTMNMMIDLENTWNSKKAHPIYTFGIRNMKTLTR